MFFDVFKLNMNTRRNQKNQDVIWARVNGQDTSSQFIRRLVTRRKKATCLQRNRGKKRQHTWEQIYVCLNSCHETMSHFCTVADHLKQVHECTSMQVFASSSVLHAFCILLNQGASACRQIFNACVKMMRISHMQTHRWHIHTLTHTYIHWVSPLPSLSLKKKKTKQKLRHTPALLFLSQNEGIN